MPLDTIFINLPIKDLPRAVAFYTQLGWTQHPVFKGEGAQCMCLNEHIHLMLQTESHLRRFTDKPICDPATAVGVLLCLHCDSSAQVDELVRIAVSAGGTTTDAAQDLGFLYTHGFTDPEGYIWKLNHIYPTRKS
jgi:predicted lactoylglutathione lyase